MILLHPLISVERYATISKELNMKTTHMFDREREKVIKFMIYCNVTTSNGTMDSRSVQHLQRLGNKTKIMSSTNAGPSHSYSVQFRKQVRIHVLDRYIENLISIKRAEKLIIYCS